MGSDKNGKKKTEAERLEALQNTERRFLNGMYGDFFGQREGNAPEGSGALTFGDGDGSEGGGSAGARKETAGNAKAESRIDALEAKGRKVASDLSSRADALLGRRSECSQKKNDGAVGQAGGSPQAGGEAGGLGEEMSQADGLIRKQKEMSSALGGRRDALQRANEALREVQSLLDNPLYDGMPSLTGSGSLSPDAGAGTSAGTGEIREDGRLPEAGEAPLDAPAAQAAGPGGREPAAQEPEKDPMEELEGLIGLSKIKHDVKELMDFVKIQKLRKDGGLKSVPVSLHLVFTGNPGTGKTTVARILARLYRQIGVLSKGQLVEVDRSGLVAGYVGQTALKTAKKIEEAGGGVLFIDEAYALARKDDAFGQEAIDTILKAMEDSREDFVVIVAGYTGPMEDFINSNPGLKSRFNKYIDFPDYSIDELMGIFDMNCKKYDYEAEDDVKAQIRAMIVQRKLAARENFANAREVRNLFEEIITNQARRVAGIESPSQEDMKKILLEDLTETAEEDAARTLEKAAAENAVLNKEALRIAKDADAVIFVGGLDHNYDVEGQDREDMKLPLDQNDIIKKLLKIRPDTVVVMYAGSPVEMPWLKDCKSLLWSYYAGMEGGNALADIIFGDVNPSGKLAETFPVRYEDTVTAGNGEFARMDRVEYREGLYVGYRYYEKKKIKPAFAFGFGLSYSSFKYSDIRVSMDKDEITVRLKVKNTGKLAGKEVVELYASEDKPVVDRPLKELKGFTKVSVKAGGTKEALIRIKKQELAYYDEKKGDFVLNSGTYTLHIGPSSDNIVLTAKITL